MIKNRIVIIGAGLKGSTFYYCFRTKDDFEIVGIADVTGEGINLEQDDEIKVSHDLEEILSITDITIIVETTNDPQIQEAVFKLKPDKAQVVTAEVLDLLMNVGLNKEQKEAEFKSILGSIQDAVEIVDKEGVITYVNPTFEYLTGISRHDRIGKNIFDVGPDSPLAIVLKNNQPIQLQKGYIASYDRELILNASPIMIRDDIQGAIMTFRSLTDVVKLMEELQKSTSVIEGLYEKIIHLNGLSELNVSDIMSIDKMEQLLLRQALTKYGYSVEGKKKAAKALNISLATLYNKLKKYQIS